jgi:signal transduction histidine kinase
MKEIYYYILIFISFIALPSFSGDNCVIDGNMVPELIDINSLNTEVISSLHENISQIPDWLRRMPKEEMYETFFLILGIAFITILILFVFMWFILVQKLKNNKLLESKNREISLKNDFISEQKEELLAQAEQLILHQQDLEKLVEERTKELIIAKEKAEESSKLKTEFFNNLSHELRTPLNAIIGFANILTSYDITQDEKEMYSEIIQESSDKLLQLLNDVIEISELNTKQCRLFKSNVNLQKICVNLINKHSAKAFEKKLELRIGKTVMNEEVFINTDKYRLKNILTRLTENAIKFTEKGFVEIGYNLKNNNIEFYVKDTGIGIDNDKKEKIFKSFSQENIQISQDFGGLGIGLAIAKENVKLLGGNIYFESEKNSGTTFFINLPANDVKINKDAAIQTQNTDSQPKDTILLSNPVLRS